MAMKLGWCLAAAGFFLQRCPSPSSADAGGLHADHRDAAGAGFSRLAFEYRSRNARLWFWDWAFAAGSTLAAFSQGVIPGAILQGVSVTVPIYSGGWSEWLSPFSILTGASVVAGYALIGTCWLIYRTEHDLRDRAYRLAARAGVVTVAAVVAVSLATPFLIHDYFIRWFETPGI
jgi:cytochrome d ubiquinol oxidase subunit II